MIKKLKPKHPVAWAWRCDFGLCGWAASKRSILLESRGLALGLRTRPSPEAKPTRVRLVPLADYKELDAALEEKRQREAAALAPDLVALGKIVDVMTPLSQDARERVWRQVLATIRKKPARNVRI
jgi:hypothetical protein